MIFALTNTHSIQTEKKKRQLAIKMNFIRLLAISCSEFHWKILLLEVEDYYSKYLHFR